jgi:hypothetical protein
MGVSSLDLPDDQNVIGLFLEQTAHAIGAGDVSLMKEVSGILVLAICAQ